MHSFECYGTWPVPPGGVLFQYITIEVFGDVYFPFVPLLDEL